MGEIKKINVEHEIMGLQYYIEAMQKHEHRKATLEDLGNLMIHVNNLKAWAGITDTEQQSNCNLPHVSNLVCPTHGTMLYKHPNGLAYCSLCNYSISWQTCC